ncbi:MAG: hypothetical protein G3M78_02290 [Candidatus Nitrohelix vancouverensis]|uniref:Uncharacterized protein n=1 Tax=Candidatus Nitrohelix vancouverensis TaxID=2705534 RepID=A0A7T0C0J8_9BACT|nr:MAG: hypothetical protein G3M78_02290 [Candidatus Nitrohelix vancouverensis]
MATIGRPWVVNVVLRNNSHDNTWRTIIEKNIGGIVEALAKKVEQFAFHGFVGFKQSLENYLTMDKLVGKDCHEQEGLLSDSHKQIAEVFIRDIALYIYKIFYDQTSQIKYRELKNRVLELENPNKQKLIEYIDKIDELIPSKDCLKSHRDKRLAHLDELEITKDLQSQFPEMDFYQWFLCEVREHGKIRFMDYLQAFCYHALAIVERDSSGFMEECQGIKNKSVIFWAFATKVVKDNNEADELLQRSRERIP